jgi:predicted HicB family RNase H-like nuclease
MSQQFNKIRTTLTLDPEVHEHYLKMAEADDRSLSYLINKILKDLMKEREPK